MSETDTGKENVDWFVKHVGDTEVSILIEALGMERDALLLEVERLRAQQPVVSVKDAVNIIMADFDKIGDQRSPEPSIQWQNVFSAMNKDHAECGWTDWPSILYAALNTMEDGDQ